MVSDSTYRLSFVRKRNGQRGDGVAPLGFGVAGADVSRVWRGRIVHRDTACRARIARRGGIFGVGICSRAPATRTRARRRDFGDAACDIVGDGGSFTCATGGRAGAVVLHAGDSAGVTSNQYALCNTAYCVLRSACRVCWSDAGRGVRDSSHATVARASHRDSGVPVAARTNNSLSRRRSAWRDCCGGF